MYFQNRKWLWSIKAQKICWVHISFYLKNTLEPSNTSGNKNRTNFYVAISQEIPKYKYNILNMYKNFICFEKPLMQFMKSYPSYVKLYGESNESGFIGLKGLMRVSILILAQFSIFLGFDRISCIFKSVNDFEI